MLRSRHFPDMTHRPTARPRNRLWRSSFPQSWSSYCLPDGISRHLSGAHGQTRPRSRWVRSRRRSRSTLRTGRGCSAAGIPEWWSSRIRRSGSWRRWCKTFLAVTEGGGRGTRLCISECSWQKMFLHSEVQIIGNFLSNFEKQDF